MTTLPHLCQLFTIALAHFCQRQERIAELLIKLLSNASKAVVKGRRSSEEAAPPAESFTRSPFDRRPLPDSDEETEVVDADIAKSRAKRRLRRQTSKEVIELGATQEKAARAISRLSRAHASNQVRSRRLGRLD